MTLVYDLQPAAIKIHGNVAFAHYHYVQIVKDATGKDKETSGRWTDILMKQGALPNNRLTECHGCLSLRNPPLDALSARDKWRLVFLSARQLLGHASAASPDGIAATLQANVAAIAAANKHEREDFIGFLSC